MLGRLIRLLGPVSGYRSQDRRLLGMISLAGLFQGYAQTQAVNTLPFVRNTFGLSAAVPALENRGGGAIVVTASVAGLTTWEVDPVYTMTKHAVVGLVRALAPALEQRGITLNAVCPAAVATKIFGPEAEDFVREAGLRLMPPSQIADAVIEAAVGVETGQCLVCYDGHAPKRYTPAPLPRLND